MLLEENKIYSGFRLFKITPIKEINGTSYEFTHEKSGARLLYLATDDDNKVFSISFRTTPTDDTGIAHITEHSVLCGSRKYPLKEPFVELVKGSLNTFLNAMTYPDKTMYPVASQNDVDFQNLMDVYLDAVFYPQMLKTPEILMQEGWHYEIAQPSDELTYSGVVYNEMKGALSSPEGSLERKTLNALFPDNTYAFESGGDPISIPNLTQKQFCDFHKRYYHPSNSYIYLYGKLDIIEKLAFLDAEYLSHFSAIPVPSHIDKQAPFSAEKDLEDYYAISSQEDKTNKTFLSYSFVIPEDFSPEETFAAELLDLALLKSEAAPLRQALMQAELGSDVSSIFETSLLQPYWSIDLSGSNIDKKEKFKTVFWNTINDLIKNGIDKELLQASFNITEFKLREAEFGRYPKGLIYNIQLMNTWLYDKDPTLSLCYEQYLNYAKRLIEEDGFGDLLRRLTVDNSHRLLFTMLPDEKLLSKQDTVIRKKLADYKKGLSSAEIEQLIAMNKALKLRQSTPDTEKALHSIPLLKISDIQREKNPISYTTEQMTDWTLVQCDQFTNGITYLEFYFAADTLPLEQLPQMFFFTELLTAVSTKKHHYTELSNLINLYTGGISFTLKAMSPLGDTKTCLPKLVVKTRCLDRNLPKLLEILQEISTQSIFTEKSRLLEIAKRLRTTLELSFSSASQQLVHTRLEARFSTEATYNEKGMQPFYNFLKDLTDNFSTRIDTLIETLQTFSSKLFHRDRLVLGITNTAENIQQLKSDLQKFVTTLPLVAALPKEAYTPKLLAHYNEAFTSSSQVQYVGIAGKITSKVPFKRGDFLVLATILRYDYFWNQIRVLGGAYGAFVNFGRDKVFCFSSYRDPHLKNTLAVYKNLPKFLEEMQLSVRELNKYIIGTISNIDMPLTPPQKGTLATSAYITGLTNNVIQAERNAILDIDKETLTGLAPLLQEALQNAVISTVGNEQKLTDNSSLFDKLSNIYTGA